MPALKKEKDQSMAKYMKDHGIERKHCRCPMCHSVILLTQVFSHLSNHGGRVSSTGQVDTRSG